MMNAHGWRGIHAADAIAHGDGPNTFADLVTQEFQWSRSLMMVLLQYTPGVLRRLPPKLRFQFLFCQLWYPLFSLFMLLMYLLPIAALAFDVNLVGMTYPDFLIHTLPAAVIVIAMAYRWRRLGCFRPVDAKVLSWEGALFQFARWPWSLLGCLAAVRDWCLGRTVEFRVTPKGADLSAALPNRVLLPYGALSILSAAAVAVLGDITNAGGFYIFALVNSVIYTLLLLVIVIRHRIESGARPRRAGWPAAGASLRAGLIVAALVVPTVAATLHARDGLDCLLIGADKFAAAQSDLYSRLAGAAATIRVHIIADLTGRR